MGSSSSSANYCSAETPFSELYSKKLSNSLNNSPCNHFPSEISSRRGHTRSLSIPRVDLLSTSNSIGNTQHDLQCTSRITLTKAQDTPTSSLPLFHVDSCLKTLTIYSSEHGVIRCNSLTHAKFDKQYDNQISLFIEILMRLPQLSYIATSADTIHFIGTLNVVYTISTNIFSIKSAPKIKRNNPVLHYANGNIFCLSGEARNEVIRQCEMYDIKTDTWSPMANLNKGHYKGSVCVLSEPVDDNTPCHDNNSYKIAIMGGLQCKEPEIYSPYVEIYDSELCRWKNHPIEAMLGIRPMTITPETVLIGGHKRLLKIAQIHERGNVLQMNLEDKVMTRNRSDDLSPKVEKVHSMVQVNTEETNWIVEDVKGSILLVNIHWKTNSIQNVRVLKTRVNSYNKI